MAIVISKERTQILDRLLSFEMDEEQRYFIYTPQAMFNELADFAEMHYFASKFSGAQDPTVLRLIINDKQCDKATALMIFWRVFPRSYTQFTDEEEAKPSYADFIFTTLKMILSNWENGFYTHHQLAYDPRSLDPYEVDTPDPNEKWPIPESIKVALPGEVVVVEQ